MHFIIVVFLMNEQDDPLPAGLLDSWESTAPI